MPASAGIMSSKSGGSVESPGPRPGALSSAIAASPKLRPRIVAQPGREFAIWLSNVIDLSAQTRIIFGSQPGMESIMANDPRNAGRQVAMGVLASQIPCDQPDVGDLSP